MDTQVGGNKKKSMRVFFYGDERRKGKISVFHCKIDFCISQINNILF